ncbi:MAG: DUF4174 domain-containing protein [Planctomycetota bacterium]
MRRFPYKCLSLVTALLGAGAGCIPEVNTPRDRSPIEPTQRPANPETALMDMEDFAWTHRPLLLFADERGQQNRDVQLQRVKANQDGLTDRDMVVVEIVDDQITIDGQPREADAAALRSRYDINPDEAFTVLLVGKDTGVKLRRDVPVTIDEVFGLIDSMPMRRQEMGNASR